MSANGWGAQRSRSVTWYEPALPAAAAAELAGREVMQAIIDRRLRLPPFMSILGAELVSVDEGEALFGIVPDESTYNPLGIVAGGLLCTMLDSAAGGAVQTLLPAGVGLSSIEIKVTFLKPLRAGQGPVEIHGHALRVGSRIAFAEAHARNSEGELVGHATTSFALWASPVALPVSRSTPGAGPRGY
jgi:uncharacterized protein (TIGR00369 family)